MFNNLPIHIQDRILLKRGIRKESIDKLAYNGISESQSKEPSIMLSFAALMFAFYLFSKED
jgi:hypothetical protein